MWLYTTSYSTHCILVYMEILVEIKFGGWAQITIAKSWWIWPYMCNCTCIHIAHQNRLMRSIFLQSVISGLNRIIILIPRLLSSLSSLFCTTNITCKYYISFDFSCMKKWSKERKSLGMRLRDYFLQIIEYIMEYKLIAMSIINIDNLIKKCLYLKIKGFRWEGHPGTPLSLNLGRVRFWRFSLSQRFVNHWPAIP